jgi:hypothetical protein
VVPGPGDEIAAVQGRGRGCLRASHADREQVIGNLKDAFVQGRLTKDEFDLRVSQAFASRTYAELATVTVGLPAEPTAAQPPKPVQTQGEIMQRPGRMMAVATALYAGVWAFVWLLPWPRNSEGDPPHPLGFLFFPCTLIYPLVLLSGVVNMVVLWREERSGGRPPRPPSAGPDAQLPPGDHGRQRPYGPRPAQVPDWP